MHSAPEPAVNAPGSLGGAAASAARTARVCRALLGAPVARVIIGSRTHWEDETGTRAPDADPGYVATLGVPVIGAGGLVLGSITVMDRVPRSWGAGGLEMLRDVAGGLAEEIELRRDLATAMRAARADANERREVRERADGDRVAMCTLDASDGYCVEAAAHADSRECEAVPAGAHDALVAVDARGVICGFNAASERMFGFGQGEAIGMDAGRLIKSPHADGRETGTLADCIFAPESRLLERRVEVRGIRRDGSTFPAELTAVRLPKKGQSAFTCIVRDLSQQKAEEGKQARLIDDLAAEQAFLRSILNQLPVGVIVADLATGELLSGNDEITRIFRRPFIPSRGTDEYASWPVFHQDGREVQLDEWPLVRVMKTGLATTGDDFGMVRGDGSRGFIRISAAPVSGYTGRNLGAIVIDDTTERVTAASALAVSEERYRLVSRATNDVIWDWDMGDRVVWSEAAATIFGHVGPEMSSVSWWYDHLHPADVDRVKHGLHAAIRRGDDAWSDEYRYRRADGSYAVVFDRGYVVRAPDGRPVRMIGAMTDVSSRTRAEEAIRFQAGLLDAVQQAVVATDNDGRILFWNRFAEQLYGWPASEVLGRAITDVLLAEASPAFAESVAATLRRRTSWAGDIVLRRKDGETFTVYVTMSPLYGKNGALLGMVGVSLDETERRHLEEQLRQAQKMEAVGQLAGGIAHDFNNLVTVIKVHGEFVLEGIDPESPAVADIKEVLDAAARAAALTRQLLAFSRKQIVRPRPMDLNESVAELEKLLRRLIGADIEVATEAHARGYVVADSGQIEQIIINLAVNARDAMPNGGQLRIRTESVTLDGRDSTGELADARGKYILLAVDDTGCGMTPAIRARIFDPFFTTKEPGRGTGLGLSTVYGIVKQAGGFVDVVSAPDCGSNCRIYLPEVAPPAAQCSAEAKFPASAGAGETVLVVEDEHSLRGPVKRILSRHGYQVLEARNGRDGLAVAAAHDGPIDLVLTDAVMPEMGGADMVRALLAVRPTTEVLYMSGYTDDDMIRRGVLDPAVAFLEKPFTVQELVARVRHVLDAKACRMSVR